MEVGTSVLLEICAVHESLFGPSRHFAAAQQFGPIWGEADINHRAGFMMGWTPPDGIGVPKVEVLSTT